MEVIQAVVSFRMDVVDFQVVDLSFVALRLAATDCTSIVVSLEDEVAIVKIGLTVFPLVPAGRLPDPCPLDGLYVGMKFRFPVIPLRFVTKELVGRRYFVAPIFPIVTSGNHSHREKSNAGLLIHNYGRGEPAGVLLPPL